MPASDTLRPTSLILASRYDVSCDFVVSALRRNGQSYFRLNSEDLPSYSLCLDPRRRRLSCRRDDFSAEIEADSLAGVYFRRPTFLREASQIGQKPENQFLRAQWAAFERNLMVFASSRWVNHPTRTYEAEHKMVQLKVAFDLGFEVPWTYCLNADRMLGSQLSGCPLAVKGLDTVLIRTEVTESFGYTNLLCREQLEKAELKSAPLVVQQGLVNKVDLRVTVVEDELWCAAITEGGLGIEGDWRLKKQDVTFSEYVLPDSVKSRCIELTHRLGLSFAAIDLALAKDRYWFLELNPTGEWAWLQEEIGFPISDSIAQLIGRVPVAGFQDA